MCFLIIRSIFTYYLKIITQHRNRFKLICILKEEENNLRMNQKRYLGDLS